MNLSWTALRSLNGSQHKAFEELVCQLAAQERAPDGSRFVRLGAPDAGIEGFWELPNGDLWGWQTKFFLSTPGRNQWRQIDASVKDALEKRPRITRLTISIPLDREDPRIETEKWFMDQWNLHVARWKGWVGGHGVEFDFWGQHEIFERLSREENRGRAYFWFTADVLSLDWFRNRLQETIDNAGARYTPELNVELPIAGTFEGLGRTDAFFLQLQQLVAGARKQYREASAWSAPDAAPEAYGALDEAMTRLVGVVRHLPRGVGKLDWEALRSCAHDAAGAADACRDRVETVRRERRGRQATEQGPGHAAGHLGPYDQDPLRDIPERLYALESQLWRISAWTETAGARAANIAALLLVGYAGTGKTHLLCDMAKGRLASSMPTAVLLGQHFRNGEPWSQMVTVLGLTCGRDEFLGALNAAGEANGCRALLCIDALNESEGKSFWSGHLPAMLTAVSRYPWLGLVVSVRSSYESLIVTEGLVPARLVRAEHTGFADHEMEATRAFFDHYGIERPSVPLLTPEFQNPLFLKLFCRGLLAAGQTRIPKGLEGVTTVFAFFLDNINTKLARPEELDFNPKRQLVMEATRALVRALADRSEDWLPDIEAEDIVNELLPQRSYENSLYRRLVTEGVLAEDRYLVRAEREEGYRNVEGVRFAYERLSDHLKARYLLDEHLDARDPSSAFVSDMPLGRLVADESVAYANMGLVEALSIQLPERIAMELGEAAPHCADFQPVREAFVESIIWRKPTAILHSTLDHARGHALRDQDTRDAFTDAVLTVATSPDHPFNADFLHGVLMRRALPERDACWSIYLHERFSGYGSSPVERLVDWAWHAPDKSSLSDQSARLTATALCWFLTTSNRTLRDQATKALVELLTPRLGVIMALVDQFSSVDDPYVSERLYAVAYGCAMRSRNRAGLQALAQAVYDAVFRGGDPPPNILLRDYARGVIEVALNHGMQIDGAAESIRPPYRSTWPEDIISDEQVEALKRSPVDGRDQAYGLSSIFDSLGRHGDFARYVIGTNHWRFDWLPRRLNEPKLPSRKQLYDEFVASLTERQRTAFDEWVALRQLARGSSPEWLEHLREETSFDYSEEQLKELAEYALSAFMRTIRRRKTELFHDHVMPYLENPNRKDDWFDLSLIQRWIVGRVFDLGWTAERFGVFDSCAKRNNDGRMSHSAERIGKKYQWIAYYEILARAADNFVFRGDSWVEEREGKYVSPAQLSERNIDPSITEVSTPADRWNSTQRTWWTPVDVDMWHPENPDATWLPTMASVPDIRALLDVSGPDGERWIVLDGFYMWREPANEDEEGSEGLQGREVRYWLTSYLVPEDHLEQWVRWGERTKLADQHFSEPLKLLHIFAGEIPWAPAYKHLHPDAASPVDEYGFDSRYPSSMYLTTQEYNWERGYDNSIEESISFNMPSAYLMQEIPLRWNGQGRYSTTEDELAAIDPSVLEPGPSVLLLNRAHLLRFLAREKLALVWIVTGEKNAYGKGGPRANREEAWLGRTHMTGLFTLDVGGGIEGHIRTEFRPAGSQR